MRSNADTPNLVVYSVSRGGGCGGSGSGGGGSMGPYICIHVLGMFAVWFNIPSRVSLQFMIKMSASEKLE
jgi:hypothetical protein